MRQEEANFLRWTTKELDGMKNNSSILVMEDFMGSVDIENGDTER